MGLEERAAVGMKAAIPAASWPRFCMSSSIRGTSRATLLMSPAIGAERGNRTPRGVVDGRHAALVVQFAHVLGPPRGVEPRALAGELPSRRPRRPASRVPLGRAATKHYNVGTILPTTFTIAMKRLAAAVHCELDPPVARYVNL